jgi:hypothetical protein
MALHDSSSTVTGWAFVQPRPGLATLAHLCVALMATLVAEMCLYSSLPDQSRVPKPWRCEQAEVLQIWPDQSRRKSFKALKKLHDSNDTRRMPTAEIQINRWVLTGQQGWSALGVRFI